MIDRDRDDFPPLEGEPAKQVRVFQMDGDGKPIKKIAEYETEEDAARKHRPRMDRREAVEQRNPEGTTYVPMPEWLQRHKS
jgi:hypothetical protein